MNTHAREDATAAYEPKEGHSVVIYTHKFKPKHFSEGVKIVTTKFPAAQAKFGKKRHNIFLRRPSTHELVNVSFFIEGAVEDWHESKHRQTTVESLQDMLERPIDVQVFKVARVIGS